MWRREMKRLIEKIVKNWFYFQGRWYRNWEIQRVHIDTYKFREKRILGEEKYWKILKNIIRFWWKKSKSPVETRKSKEEAKLGVFQRVSVLPLILSWLCSFSFNFVQILLWYSFHLYCCVLFNLCTDAVSMSNYFTNIVKLILMITINYYTCEMIAATGTIM